MARWAFPSLCGNFSRMNHPNMIFETELVLIAVATNLTFDCLKGDGGLALPFGLVPLFPFTKLHVLEILESMHNF